MLTKSQYLKEWRRKNKSRVDAYNKVRAPIDADRRLQKKYGITLKDRNRLLRKQGYRCAGCRSKKDGHWHIDHCHRTKRVRGVLCQPCNMALGLTKDLPATLRRLASYLEK